MTMVAAVAVFFISSTFGTSKTGVNILYDGAPKFKFMDKDKLETQFFLT